MCKACAVALARAYPHCCLHPAGNSTAALQQLCTATPNLQVLNLSMNPMLSGKALSSEANALHMYMPWH